MKLLVGLGNPGPRYAGHRHNIGFRAADAVAEAHGFGPWRARFQGAVSEGRLGTEKVLLLKPETYMNLAGDAVQAASRFYKLDPADIIVFHDELDLAPGKVRVKTGGGQAGHNGLRSLAAHLGPDFTRVRLGIGHPGDKARVNAHVLGDFAKADQAWLEPLLEGIADGAPALVAGDTARFLDAINRRRQPAPQTAGAAGAPASPPPRPSPEPEPDARSPLQRLVDRFR